MSSVMNISMGKNKMTRIVLNTEKLSCNYIEKTTGVDYNVYKSEHRCLKCCHEVNWVVWPTVNTAKSTCSDCGEKLTLSIKNLEMSKTF
jgi:transcription elongation factor Elf1